MAGEAGAPGSILLQDAIIDANEALPGGHYLLRLTAPGIAARARPGQFVHLRCGPDLPMRRPLSILRATAHSGQIELLYKAVGVGTRQLADAPSAARRSACSGRSASRSAPIRRGRGCSPSAAASACRRCCFWPQTLARPTGAVAAAAAAGLRSGVSVPAAAVGHAGGRHAGGQSSPPCRWPRTGALPSRLASGQGFPGCFEGHVTAACGCLSGDP